MQFMYKYTDGANGLIVSNRVACGRKMSLTYEIQCTKGSIYFTQERMNEVKIYRHDDNVLERGFKTVLIAPGHGVYDKYFGGAGISIGYSDQKTIEAYEILKAVNDGVKIETDFNFGYKINRVIDGVLQSAENKNWVKINY